MWHGVLRVGLDPLVLSARSGSAVTTAPPLAVRSTPPGTAGHKGRQRSITSRARTDRLVPTGSLGLGLSACLSMMLGPPSPAGHNADREAQAGNRRDVLSSVLACPQCRAHARRKVRARDRRLRRGTVWKDGLGVCGAHTSQRAWRCAWSALQAVPSVMADYAQGNATRVLGLRAHCEDRGLG